MSNSKQTILIVEDDLINRKIVKKNLEEKYNIIEAENGKEGLECIDNSGLRIVAILLDLVMPVMDGFEFLEEIKKTELKNIPIIVMTGEENRVTEEAVLKAGASDFIHKPYNATVLDFRLKNAIAQSKMSMYKHMKHLSEHDLLTGMYNRTKFFDSVEQMISAHPEEEHVFIRVDIDHFSLYNSAFGEEAGDKLICLLADLIRSSVSNFDNVVYGSINADIFCVCAEYHGQNKVIDNYLKKVQNALNDYSKDYVLHITAGAYVILPNETEKINPGEYYLKASIAAKKSKHRVDFVTGFYDDESRKQIDADMIITNEMQEALDNEEFIVYFQPKYEVMKDVPCGAEALVRWQHPVKGIISPGAFIPVFERTGFIGKVDYYVWEHTCQYLRKWIDDGLNPKPVSVNISRVSLYNGNLDNILEDLVKKYNVDPKLLELEITENAYMTNPEQMRKLIVKLHDKGFTILMDDFGSDHSSLNALKNIDVDTLKIDMAFIPKEDDVEKGEIILASIIKMAKWIGMEVIVEGVESRRYRDFLEGAGCDVIQGYYYSKPLPPEKYEENYIYQDNSLVKDNDSSSSYDESNMEGTLLIIDDSEIFLEIAKSQLGGLYNIKTCTSAEEALIYLRKHADLVKVIMVDNVMPGMSGIDFIKFCQNNADLHKIPKIMITANDNMESHIEAFEAGAYDFITKPFTKEVVAARIKRIMDTTYHFSNYARIKQDYFISADREIDMGILSKKSFNELSDKMMETFPEDPMALLVIDLDDFSEINKKVGYEKGTEILESIAAHIKKQFRKSDVIGKISDDEYAILLCGIPDKKTVKQKSSMIARDISYLGASRFNIRLTASVGVVYPTDSENTNFEMEKAHIALEEAKKYRKGSCVVYGETVPVIKDDKKDIILFCSGSFPTFKDIALAYGDSKSFALAKNCDEVKENIMKYKERIKIVCIDMNTPMYEKRKECEDYKKDSSDMLSCAKEYLDINKVTLFALCKYGDKTQLQAAVKRNIANILPLYVQSDIVQEYISMALMKNIIEKPNTD